MVHSSVFLRLFHSPTRLLLAFLLLPRFFNAHPVAALASANSNVEAVSLVGRLLRDYMSAPTEVLSLISDYHLNGAFSNDLRAPDRDAILRLHKAVKVAYPAFEAIFYGFEDGTFVFTGESTKSREPGESGYAVEVRDDGTEDAGSMQKYYKACVGEDGASIACVLGSEESYTSCIDECAMVKCPDENSQKNCSVWSSNDSNYTEMVEECEAEIKWCRSYEIKMTPEIKNDGGDDGKFGFVPASYYCVDKQGLSSQAAGASNKCNTDGGCYFDDGITSVNRSLEGDYAYCGGNGQVCNDTYAGAFSQDNYDPRWRPWYIETRKLQTANWAEPYIYFNSVMGFGTSYCHPIYTTPQEGQADDEKTEFLGVLAIDYTLDNITDMLVKNFDSEVFEDTTVAVFEDKPPYFLIGTSEAELRPTICHENEFDNKCTTKRRKITDLTGSSILSAYSEQKLKSFPGGESIEIKLEKGEGAGYLISRSATFHTADVGAEWRILVVNSANLVGSDTIKPGDSMFALTVAIATIGTVFCSILTYLYLSNRTEREIINSDWRFTGAFLISCILLSASSLCYIGPNSDALCMLRMWLPNLFFVTTLALLFVKNIRMYRLVGRGFSREKISHAKTAAMAVPIVLVQVIMLTICSFVDPSKRTEDIENIRTDSTYRVCCKHKSNTFVFIIYAYEAVLILAGCVVAFKTRNLMEEFGEAKQILLTMYDIALVSSILLFIKLTGAVDEQAMEYVFAVLAIFMATCFSCSVFVLPRWTQIQIRMQATAASTGRVTFGGGAAMEPLIANGERTGI